MLLAVLFACAPPPDVAPERDAVPDVVPIDAPDRESADWTVDCNGGGDFATISEAIAAASDGQWIQVEPCTYAETVDFGGKSVWISSTAGSADTIIDARGSYGVIASRGEGDGAALVGFTIQNGGGTYGTVYVTLAALRLEDVVITGSRNGYFVLYTTSGDVELQDVTITDSSAYYYTIDMMRGAVVADGLTVDCAGASYAMMMGHGSFFLDHSEVSCRSGYSVYFDNSPGRIQRSTLHGAVGAETDEDHYSDTNRFENTLVVGSIAQTYGTLIFRNSVLDGGSITGSDIYELKLEASVFLNAPCAYSSTWSGQDTEVTPSQTVAYNDFHRLSREGCDGSVLSGIDGNIAEDPQFTDPMSGDYSVPATSPLVDAGLEEDEYADPDGTRNDIGLYGGPRSLGGGW